MAYGFRDSDYFFLKIKAAVPGESAMNLSFYSCWSLFVRTANIPPLIHPPLRESP